MSDTFCDVLVLGAGPAGSATALFLARAGFDVLLADREQFPRDKPCGEYLTPGAVRLLRDELDVLPEMLAKGARRLTCETIVPHYSAAFGGETDALACPRIVTDSIVRNAAAAAGARIVENFSARTVLREGDGVCGLTGTRDDGETHTFRPKIIVGADGTRSMLARALGVVRPVRRLQRIALVTHYRAGEADSCDSVTMHLPRDGSDACCGVGAPCGPDGSRNINIVVPLAEAAFIAGRRQEYFDDRLRRSFPQVWEQTENRKRIGPLHSIGCFGHHTTRAADSGAVLVGDAATFINPFTGEGVFFALRGAKLAAEAICQALERGDVSRSRLQSYDAARRAELLPRYRLCDAVQRVVHSPPMLAWAAGRLRRSVSLTELLLQTVGDLARPADLFSLPALRLALSTL